MLNLTQRPRRLRGSAVLRNLLSETHPRLAQLIQPYFLTPQPIDSEPIAGFMDVRRWGEQALIRRIEQDMEKGIRSFLLFGSAVDKDPQGTEAFAATNTVSQALPRLRAAFGREAVFFTDVCLCPYTSHGHCGVWDGKDVENDSSVKHLVSMALAHARAGADFVAPSDMMDGRVGAIRQALDAEGFSRVGILAYTAKYASNYYGPFRQAVDSSPEAGSDRAGYQMDFRNRVEADRELRLDLAEGADMVMVKPALAYLDIVAHLRAQSDIPIVAYSVSGEYLMVKLMAQAGLAEERRLLLENLTAILRAGAAAVITYHASQAAEQGWLK